MSTDSPAVAGTLDGPVVARGAGRVAILQSNYLPWKGYFDIINDVDLFIFYDDVQYTKNDWRNRNRIKAAQGPEWMTIPAGDGIDRLVCDVVLANPSWQVKHWRTLSQNYGKCAHFARYREYFEHVYLSERWEKLSDLNQSLITRIAGDFLGLQTVFADSRAYPAPGAKLDRVLELLAACGAKSYVSGPSAKDYIDPRRFDGAAIELIWKDYSGYPPYPQRFPPFEHGVSIVDLLFNTGPEAGEYIWGWRKANRS